MDISFDAPSIKWEWNPGAISYRGNVYDGTLIVTATGDAQGRGLVAIQGEGPDGEIPERRSQDGEDEASLTIHCHHFDKVTVKAYILFRGAPASGITTESYEVPPLVRTPDPEPQPEPKQKLPPPIIEYEVISSGVIRITADNKAHTTDYVMLRVGGREETGRPYASIEVRDNPGTKVTASAFLYSKIDGRINQLSDESKLEITIPVKRPTPTPNPEPQKYKILPPDIEWDIQSAGPFGRIDIKAKAKSQRVKLVVYKPQDYNSPFRPILFAQDEQNGWAKVSIDYKTSDLGKYVEAIAYEVDSTNHEQRSDKKQEKIEIPRPAKNQPETPCEHMDEHNEEFEALLNKIKTWYSTNSNKPLTADDLEKRFSKKY